MKTRRIRLGIHQKRALLDLLEETFYFVDGNDPAVRGNIDKKSSWRIIAGKLNKMGPIRKAPDIWRNSWCTMKYKVREKYRKCKSKATAGKYDFLTEDDWRIIKLCSLTESGFKPRPSSNVRGLEAVNPSVIIQTPATSDNQKKDKAATTTKHLIDIPSKPIVVVPKPLPTEPKFTISQPATIKLPTLPSIPQNSCQPISSMSVISQQLSTVVKLVESHNDTQRHMLIELQENNRMQKDLIKLLADIKTRLPQ